MPVLPSTIDPTSDTFRQNESAMSEGLGLIDAELAVAHPKLGPEARKVLGVENAIKAFRSYGSTAPAEVEKQLAQWEQRLAEID